MFHSEGAAKEKDLRPAADLMSGTVRSDFSEERKGRGGVYSVRRFEI